MIKIFMHFYIIEKKKLFNTKLRYNILMTVFVIWLTGVVAWNFVVPEAAPIEDVIVAVLLSQLSMTLKKYFK